MRQDIVSREDAKNTKKANKNPPRSSSRLSRLRVRLNPTSLLRAVRTLSERDATLAMIAERYGPPPLWEREQGFQTLIHIVLEQQVSLQSARAAYDKLMLAVQPLTPQGFLKLSDTRLKEIGFSRQKTAYGQYLASAIIKGELDLDGLQRLNDDEARACLMKIKGIGSWTADIYLLMAMGRSDIWPSGDLALAGALQRVKQLPERPTFQQLDLISENWRPFRAVAARMLWHFYLSERRAK
jgi:DNA-3-methyladenine glycosylase II